MDLTFSIGALCRCREFPFQWSLENNNKNDI